MTIRGAFTDFVALVTLPTLVRRQRRLEKKIASIGTAIEDEKAVRKDIDALLVQLQFKSGDVVTCLGYDVVHHERKGQTSINADKLVALLAAAGLDRQVARWAIRTSQDTASPAKFATVKPSTGATVRAA